MTEMDEKDRLRSRILQERDDFVSRNVEATDASSTISQRIKHILGGFHAGILAVYWPIRSEVDLRSLFDPALEIGWSIALPCVTGLEQPLTFRAWTPEKPLEPGYMNIPEPGQDAEIVVPDLALVPLAAFDRIGGRLGYGGGFYDRTLANWRMSGKTVQAIGCAYAIQEVDQVPMDQHDIHLNMIVTEQETIYIRSLSAQKPI